MRIFILTFLIFNLNISFSQETIKRFKPTELFEYSYHEIGINDSIKHETLEYNNIYGPYNSLAKSQQNFSKHRKYKLENGQIISLDIYNDTTILFKEFRKSKYEESDSLISCGELKINKKSYQLIETILTNQQGEDSLAIDTVSQLIPSGFWSLNVDFKTFEIGNFENGYKTGNWYLVNSEYSSRFIPTYLKKLKYHNDSLIKEETIDRSKIISDLEKNIVGEWYNIGLTFIDVKFCTDNKCSLFFVRDSSKYKRSFANVYEYLNFTENKKLQTKISRNCGVGRELNKENKDKEWSLNNQGELNIAGEIWTIEYLSENEMILSIW